MKLEDLDFAGMLSFEPQSGRLLLGGDRMVLLRQDSMGLLRQQLRMQVGPQLTRSILSRFGYRCGQGDFETLGRMHDWDSEQDLFGAGPLLHAWEGMVAVEPLLLEVDRDRGHFHMRANCHNSYEAEVYVAEHGVGDEPACHSLTAYASGWCSAFFGAELVCIETACVAMGAECCAFETRPVAEWGEEAQPWIRALSQTEYSLSRELQRRLSVIEEQSTMIRALSTPIMEVSEGVLVLPLIGPVDSQRAEVIMETLLQRIVAAASRCVIIDVTGLESLEANTGASLARLTRSAALLGARCIITGVSPQMARTLVDLDAELGDIPTRRSLKDGLEACRRSLGRG